MTIWGLEWRRLIRTRRWLALVSVFLFLGLASPVAAYYLLRFVPTLANTFIVSLPQTRQYDGFSYFMADSMGLGLLVVVIVAAASFTLDAHRSIAIFYRTRMTNVGGLIMPKFARTFLTAAISYLLGGGACALVSYLLFGPFDVIRIIPGGILELLYLAFALSLVALLAAWNRHIVPTIGFSFAILLVLPLLSVFPSVSRWLPSALITSLSTIVAGGSLSVYVPSAGITMGASIFLLFLSILYFERRAL